MLGSKRSRFHRSAGEPCSHWSPSKMPDEKVTENQPQPTPVTPAPAAARPADNAVPSPAAAAPAAAAPIVEQAAPRVAGEYTESMIRVLDDVEHVRTRPGMYIGGYNVRGLHHLVYEIVDN